MTETVMLPHHACRALLRAESFDPAENSIEVLWSTGASVLRYDWDGPYTETLVMTPKAVRLDRLNAGAPFLNTHSSYDLGDVLGRVVPGSAKLVGSEGVCRVKLSEDPAKAGIVADIRGGVIGNVSVGYIVHQMTRTEAQGDKVASCLVTDWEPIEVSAVPIPADMNAAVRSEPTAERHPCVVTRSSPPAAPVDPAIQARAAETTRVQGVIAIARKLGLPDALADTAIAGGTALDAFRAIAIDARAAAPVQATDGRPADATTTTEASAAVAASNGDTAMSDRAHDTAVQNDPAADEARAAAAASTAAADAVAVRAQERQRIADIRLTARKLGLSEAVMDKAIDDGSTIEAFRAAAIDMAAEQQAPANFTQRRDVSDRAGARTYAQPRGERAKGTDAARCLIALAATRGGKRDAADFVMQRYGTDGEIAARALATSVGSAGGFLVPPEMSAEVIELLRPASAVMALNPNILPMPSGNLMIPRVQSGSTANYVGENQAITASQPSFGAVQLSAKKLAALVPISNDMIRFASPQTDAVVRDDMVRSVAMRADLAFIRGTGGQFSPRGMKSFAGESSLNGANALTAGYLVGSTYASQSQANAITALATVTADLSRLELALENANIPMSRPGWVMSPRSKSYLMNIRDGLGNQVYYKEMSEGMLRGKPFKVTTQIPNNLAAVSTDGTTATTDGSEIYLADFSEVFIGEAYGLELDVFPGAAYVDASGNLQSGVSNDQTVMRALVQHDMGMRQEAAVAVLAGVRWF